MIIDWLLVTTTKIKFQSQLEALFEIILDFVCEEQTRKRPQKNTDWKIN